MALESLNPATGDVLETFAEWSDEQVVSTVETVHNAYLKWRTTTFAERKPLMLKAAEVLRRRKDEFATMMALEMGKPVVEGRAEVEKCALVCEYYADNAEQMLAPEPIESDASRSYVAFRPQGIVLAVMPWNFPFWQVFRFAAPALMAGNVGVLKHASNVPRCALAIEEVFVQAGFPADVFRTLMIGSRKVAQVIEHPYVVATTLTGSDIAGRKVAEKSGAMLKKSVMELGGSDPFIVLNDADLDLAASVAVTARCINSGQSCIAAKRFIVEDGVYESFLEKFKANMAALKVGDPCDESTQVGPQAREDLMRELHDQVEASVAKGAKVALGGVPGEAAFYPPTILTEVAKGMPAYSEEFFGPVAIVIRVKDAEEALFVANDTEFGLGGSVWTTDIEKGEKIAGQIRSGAVFVNGMTKSDPRLPFGGVGISGFGRELSHYGIKEFVNIQTVWIK
ncbi:NAD-dependent succinate-semialdehyde dehydrogenase [Desulfuromonas acetoxidans]|uniref:Aldehyde dehydrogenase n=1 Tax=Desulfuromonas acetoxidans (strain DSM 684 / 11070) TaxID=281689 RepID=Q1K2S9_DESA6|nr:NAD-dependent succinate-semialdehyde dehydrogenase [Desulfuromonas acetoxidans]EAT16802.1 aldehyde dehydrogenase [Desulfuromonas acetoxidans DSM 684]MBF0644650.1 NAD-dependent succinate-semialdehyde dehydrogenase [Desulfuromonas acetoxidans]NVD23743.1 NAD-dependent succinate-semialdehyde dehydrogenase [Desulfuromonas acetoxidans]NVE15860.1 NAD-dependent succinate-semialdehyde dehydrogenase [Desulfuromonas acetoxidans]